MWQQFVDAAIELRWQVLQHVAQIGPRVQAIELGRLHQTHYHGRTLTGELAADEHPVLCTKFPGFDLPLNVIVVDGGYSGVT